MLTLQTVATQNEGLLTHKLWGWGQGNIKWWFWCRQSIVKH